jgi:hypothetical protein
MPRTIEDHEYNFLQGRKQVADFVESIWNDPALTDEAKALVKKKYPNLKIQDYDLEQRVEKRLNEERQARLDTEDKKKFNEVRSNTQKQYGFTDKAMEDLERLMVERNVGDYDVAATYVASKEPKPSSSTFQDQYWKHEKQPEWGEITKDPEGWARGEILKTLHDEQSRAKNQRF